MINEHTTPDNSNLKGNKKKELFFLETKLIKARENTYFAHSFCTCPSSKLLVSTKYPQVNDFRAGSGLGIYRFQQRFSWKKETVRDE